MTLGALPDQNSSQLMPLCGLAAVGGFGHEVGGDRIEVPEMKLLFQR